MSSDHRDQERHRELAGAAPAALAAKIRASPVVGERKPVTVLFADLVGSTALAEAMDPEEWAELLHEAFGRMAAAVYRYEGTIAQLHGDGMLAFFGAPVAHEDDPERAVRAGLDMVAAIAGFDAERRAAGAAGLALRVGVNTGPVVVASVGNDLRYDYTAVGDTTNVAARMQAAAAPGTVLVAEGTRRLVAAPLDGVDLGPLALKGKREPVRGYQVTAVGPARRRGAEPAGRMIGRDAELALLRQAVADVAGGRGGAAIVTGEPGVGKSRLLGELRRGPGGEAPAWAEARCPSYGRTVAYGLLVDVVAAVERAAGVAAGGDDAAVLAHLAGRPLPGDAAAVIERLEPQARRNAYVAATRRLLTAAAGERPLVVVCEDVHWADAASADALEELVPAAAGAPLLFVFTARADEEAPGGRIVAAARALGGGARADVALRPLSAADTATLVAELLAAGPPPGALVALVRERAAGNPLYVEEVVRMLAERGAIVRGDDGWRMAGAAASTAIPETLHGLLLSRIDRLEPAARETLRVASVIGREFDPELLGEVMGEGSAPWPAIDALVAGGLAEVEAGDVPSRPAFRHVLVQAAAYETLLLRERRALHLAVADAIERRGGGDAEQATVLARHLERADEGARAVPYLMAAADAALARFANREAIDLFERAAAQLPGDSESPDVVRLRVEAGLGRARAGFTFVPVDTANALLAATAADAAALGDLRLEGEAHLWQARVLRRMGEHPVQHVTLRRSLERLRAIAEETGDARFAALPQAVAATATLDRGEFGPAAAALAEAVPPLEDAGSLADASYFAGLTALAHARLGEFAAADPWLERCDRLAAASGDPTALLDADLFRAMVEVERGNLEAAIALATRGVEAAEAIGNHLCALAGSSTIGDGYLRRGAPLDAIPPLERSSELSAYCNAGASAVVARARLAAARARLGESAGVVSSLDGALAEAAALGDAFGQAEILRERAAARALDRDADWATVAADFESAIERLERLGARPSLARAVEEYGVALAARGDAAAAARQRGRAARLLAELEPAAARAATG